MKKYLALLLTAALLLTGCEQSTGNSDSDTASDKNADGSSSDVSDTIDSSGTSGSSGADSAIPSNTSDYFSDRDFEVGYDETESAIITLNGTSASCDSNAVDISGSTITIIDEGTYILSGALDDGMVIVNAEKSDKIQLVLKDASIHSETAAALYILQADKVFVTTAADSTNTLSNGGSFTAIDENNIDAVVFSKDDLTLNGSGLLVITSPGGHGIVSKDSLTLTSGSYDISCSNHALAGKDDVCIANADFTITSGKDGIHAENNDDAASGFVYIQSGTFDISAEGDGISAASYLLIEDGTFNITSGGGSENAASQSSDSWGNFMGGGRHQTGGGKGMKQGGTTGTADGKSAAAGSAAVGSAATGATATGSAATGSTDTSVDDSTSMKGIKAVAELRIDGGSFTINSADDSIHSNSSVTVNGGSFEIASGDDGFHADETLAISDGTINISESYEGLEGLHILVSGGNIKLTAKDDGLNAAGGADSSGMGGRDAMAMGGGRGGFSSSSGGTIQISGGTIYVSASGDGIDANGSVEITGGYTVVCGPTQGDTSVLDYDSKASISGGTFIGTGAASMTQTFSNAEQGVLAVKSGDQESGSEVTLSDNNGNVLITHVPELSYQVVIISSPDIVKGETYTITAGEASGEFTAD